MSIIYSITLELGSYTPATTNRSSNHKGSRSRKIKHTTKNNQTPIITIILLLNRARNRDSRQGANTHNGKRRSVSLPIILRRTHLGYTYRSQTNRRTTPKPKQNRIANNRRQVIPRCKPQRESENPTNGRCQDHHIKPAQSVGYQTG